MFREKLRGGTTRLTGGALAAYPIDSIYIGATATSPANLFGGTWARFGQGRVLVSQDVAQTEFDVAGETGGSKTHTLAIAELPAHLHSVGTLTTAGVSITHDHNIARGTAVGTAAGKVAQGNSTAAADTTTGNQNTNHTHTVSGDTGNPTVSGGQPHNNLQPYIVVYMWRRTA